MCGICGIHGEGLHAAHPGSPIERMARAIAHRGPDDEGFYTGARVALGHRRLSIIDLKHGHQPMTNEARNVWVAYNGEIYNFREVRAELEAKGHAFSTDCDTEVVVHGWEEWGPECVARFNGMFAFAVWDERTETLFLARDRLGIKPLYYATAGGQFLFGSEIKSILAHPAMKAEVDPDAIPEYLFATALLGGRTMFKGVHYLEPGCYLLRAGDRDRVHRYWDLPVTEHPRGDASLEELKAEVFRLLDDSVRLELMSDVPFGSLLSGGLDSSFIAGLATRHVTRTLKTFAFGFRGEARSGASSDTACARIVADAFGTDHEEFILDPADYAAALQRATYHVEKPIELTTPSVYLLYRNLRQHAKVVLSGEGADELFGGYFFFLDQARSLPLAEFPWAPYSREVSLLLEDRVARGFADRMGTALRGLVDRYRSSDPLNVVLCLFIKIYLLEMLDRQDKTSMAWGVESRVPFLDHRLVEAVVNIPSRHKLNGPDEKFLLKEAARSFLPREITARKKKPFPFPVDPRSIHHQRNRANELVQSGTSRIAGYFKKKETDDFLNKRNGFSNIDSLAIFRTSHAMIALETWHEAFGI